MIAWYVFMIWVIINHPTPCTLTKQSQPNLFKATVIVLILRLFPSILTIGNWIGRSTDCSVCNGVFPSCKGSHTGSSLLFLAAKVWVEDGTQMEYDAIHELLDTNLFN